MVTFVNRAKVNTSTTGSGTLTLGAAVIGFQTFGDAGLTNGASVNYTIEDGVNFEIGTGVYSSTGPTLARTLVQSSTGSLLNLTGNAVVFVTALASDLAPLTAGGGDLTIADKIIHSGDTNTSIRFPVADTVTVETNGVERLRISDAGLLLASVPVFAGDPQNRIINGAFDFWQRGTSSTAAGYVAADRWLNSFVGGTVTQSRQSFTVGDTLGQNSPTFFLRQTVSGQTLANQLAITEQRIEGVRSYAGQTITILGWVRRSSGSGNMVVELGQAFGTGGSPSSSVLISPQTISLTASFAPFAVTVAVPSIAGKTLGTNGNDFLGLNFWTSAGSDYNARTNSLGIQTIGVDLWGIHIKEGVHTVEAVDGYCAPELGPELVRCQRYFQTVTQGMSGQAVQGTVASLTYFPSVTFRATPSISLSAPVKLDWPFNANYTQSSASFVSGFSSEKAISVELQNFSGLTLHSRLVMRNDGGRVNFESEI